MSTIYNPLSSENFLSEFSGAAESAGSVGNGIGPETAPSSLNIGSGSGLSDALSGGIIPGMGLSAPSVGNVLKAFGIGGGASSVFPVTRIVAIILGLLLIAGGIIMFRPETVEDVKGAAALAA